MAGLDPDIFGPAIEGAAIEPVEPDRRLGSGFCHDPRSLLTW